jgi:hypothetical protein
MKNQLNGALLLEEAQEEATAVSTTSVVAKKYRVQLDFAPKDFREIDSLVEELGLSTRAELFRSALVTLRWMVQKKRTGCTIVAVTPDEKLLEPEFEFLQSLQVAESSGAKK